MKNKQQPELEIALNINAERALYLKQKAAGIIANQFLQVAKKGQAEPIDYGYGNKINTVVALFKEIEYDANNRDAEIACVMFCAGAMIYSDIMGALYQARKVIDVLNSDKDDFVNLIKEINKNETGK